MKNDFDFIKDKFDNDNITAPDSINEYNILDKLDTAEQKKIKFYQRPAFKGVVSAVACFAIAIGVFAFASNSNNKPHYVAKEDSALASFESYDDIYKQMKDMNKYYGNMGGFNLGYATDIKGEIAIDEDTIDIADSLTSGENSSDNFDDTYKQVDGVDEAYIIKNDGRYIYALNEEYNTIKIYEGTKLVGRIDSFSCDMDRNLETYENIYDMYVHNNRLIVETVLEDYRKDDYKCFTNAYIYDLSDISSPKVIKSFRQSGSLESSRMVGDVLYVVTNTYISRCKTADDCIIYDGEDEKTNAISADSICCVDDPSEPNYIIIGAVDTNTCERTAETKALFGCSNTIYCNDKNMYLVSFDEKGTIAIKATLSRDEINFVGKVDIGSSVVNNQFSMDEYNGYFRIATTDDNGNNIYIFDSNLKKVGEITGIAKDEQIQAVRFMGDTCYVITFRFTDPLFVIDLSNPAKPKLLGEVEITGFSSQLVPVDDNRILGIGEMSTTDSNGEFVNGLKLVLFDVSDKANPKVLDTMCFEGEYSNAQYNHKAIVVNKKDGYYAIDFNNYNEDKNKFEYGAMTFEIRGNKIVKTNVFTIDNNKYDIYDSHCTYIDDTIYVLDNNANIYSFKY